MRKGAGRGPVVEARLSQGMMEPEVLFALDILRIFVSRSIKAKFKLQRLFTNRAKKLKKYNAKEFSS